MGPRSRYYLLLVVLSCAVGWWYSNTRQFGHDWGDDFAQYLRHAQNIAAGRPYKQTGHLLNPKYQISPETYPPIFPLLLAPVVTAVGPGDFARLKLVGIGCLVAALLVWGWLLTAEAEAEKLPAAAWPIHLLPLIGLIAVCPAVWQQKDHILSELPYLLMQGLAFGAIAWFRRRPPAAAWRSAGAVLLLGTALWLPYGCRTTGLILIGAFALETGWRHWRQLWAAREAALALTVTAGLILLQRAYLDSHDAGYSAQLRTYFSAAQVLDNLRLYGGLASHYWGDQPGLSADGYWILGAAAALLVVLGWRWRWREASARTEEWYFAGYLLAVVLWPMPQGNRYLLPLLPLAVLYGWRGARRLPGAWGRQLPTVLAVVLMLVGRTAISRLPAVPAQLDEPDNRLLLRWVARQPPGAVFLHDKPRALALYTGHPAMVLRSCTDSALVEQDIAASGAQYLISRCDSATYQPGGARRALTTVQFRVYELAKRPGKLR